ncbi:MAG TPA: sodium:solute symporter [Ignavibacteriaceae bacterium]|nr:sodium:solute symporter [Ignavibacteriaceae bacterium]
MTGNFTLIDNIVLILYLIIVLSLGFYYSRKEKKFVDYFLAGRNIGWFVVGMSIFATNISSEHFVGLAGSGASRGLAVGQFELMAIFILIILGWLLAPIYIKSGASTMPEFLEKRFGRKSSQFFAVISLFLYFFTKITVTIFAGGLLFYKVFGLSIYASAIIILLITGLYSVIGGAAAVIRTHAFQAVLILLGAAILTIFGLHEVGGFSGLREKLPVDYFNMFKPVSDPDFPWTGIIFGAPIIAFWYWCADHYIVQKILSAKSINDARRGTLLAAFLKIFPIFILVLPGLIAAALFPQITGDEAYPTLLASDILPVGIKGFVVAGLLAAVMSSLGSVFNVTSALVTNDFYKPRHPEASDRKLVLIGRLSTTAIVITAILCVPLVKLVGSQIYIFLQSVQAFISPPITAVFLFGILMKKATSKAALWTLIIGEAFGVSRLIVEVLNNWGMLNQPFLQFYAGINYLHFAIFLFGISSILIISISFLTQCSEESKINKIKYLLSESFSEIKIDIHPGEQGIVSGYKSNLVLSVFIVLIILGLWSLWY